MIYKLSAPPQLLDNQVIDLPASKSLSNRALILQALCPKPCCLTHLSDCDDTVVMQKAFAQVRNASFSSSDEPLTIDIGAAGTSMRFLTAYFASREGAEVIMTGSERMKQRPIQILVDALRELGAQIEYLEGEGCPPLRIHGRKLSGGPLSIDGSTSSQYISALLMIAPTLEKGLQLTLTGDVTSRPYILMTLGMMEEFGVKADWTNNVITVAPQIYQAQNYEVESDWSAASYWYELLALDSSRALHTFHLKGLHKDSLQGDAQVTEYFKPLSISTAFDEGGAVLTIDRNAPLPEKLTWDMQRQPDLAQTVIVTYSVLGIHFDICGLHTLRIKETDRISALEMELKKYGTVVNDQDNDRMIFEGKTIEGLTPEQIPVYSTYKDHRMAMAFAPICLFDGLSFIDDPAVVSKSYPNYWKHLQQVGIIIDEFDENNISKALAEEALLRKNASPVFGKKFYTLVLLAILIALILLAIRFCN